MNSLNQEQNDHELILQDYEQLLITTAAGTYKGIRRLDLESEQAVYIYFEKNHIKQEPLGSWADWIEGQKKHVHPDDFIKLKEFFSLDTLRSLEDDVFRSINFRSRRKNENGYYRTYTTTASVTYLGGRRTAVMTTIDNTDAVINEMEQKKLLASAASIYVSMHVLDLKKDEIETLSSAEHITNLVNGRKKGVARILTDVMMQLTDDEYLEDMLDFINFRTLDERMEGINTITLEFLGTHTGWCRARFIVVERDEIGRIQRLLWVVENINSEKKKSNQLVYLSETDLMTGIRNRGAGEQKIKELISSNHPGIFFLLDADKFKTINDSYGHTVGDKVLIALADCLKESFRDSDVIMRLGGDEFAVFAPGITDKSLAIGIVKRLFHRVEHICIPELSGHKITVSLGIAFKKEDDGLDFDSLYHKADICTYESKKATGNAYTILESE